MRNFNSVMEQLYKEEIKTKIDKTKQCALIPHITFQVTEDCDLKCSYCYQINKTSNILHIEDAYELIEMLLHNNKGIEKYLNTDQTIGCSFDFIGGEPFLQVDLIDQILTYFVKRAIELDHPWQYMWRASLTTNGTIFNDKIKKFIQKWQTRLDITVTIDGNKENHDRCRKFPNGEGSYDKAIEFLKWQKTFSPNIINSKMTISPDNLPYFYDGIINFINLGYTLIHCNCIFEKGWTLQHAQSYYQQLKQIADYLFNNKLTHNISISRFHAYSYRPMLIEDTTNHCGGNGRMLALDVYGDLYPCIRYAPLSIKEKSKDIRLGNVKDGILLDKKIQETIKELKASNRITQSPKECIECPIAANCGWCSAYNYAQSNNGFNHRETNICVMHKAESLANVYFWNKYFREENLNKRFKMWLPDEEALKIIDADELTMLHELEKYEE